MSGPTFEADEISKTEAAKFASLLEDIVQRDAPLLERLANA